MRASISPLSPETTRVFSSKNSVFVENFRTHQIHNREKIMTQFTLPPAQASCRWTPEQIEKKQDESLRLVRERMRQEIFDGGSAHRKASPTDRVRRQLLRLRK